MSAPKHTPGPWSVGRFTGSDCRIYADPDQHAIARTYGPDLNGIGVCELTGPKNKADARLIAAAPTMLHALQVAKLSIEQMVEGYRVALVYEKDCGHQDSLASLQEELDIINDAITLATEEQA